MVRMNSQNVDSGGHIFDDGGMSEPAAIEFAAARAAWQTAGHAVGETTELKLAHERRKVPRRAVKGGAMAVFSAGKGAGTLARVELLDASWTGLGVASPVEVEPGTAVSVIPEHAMSPRQIGIVVRCEKMDEGWRLGLQCRTQRAVA
ncbi:hypothetical protein LBMAG48_05300 [Phycisphaerae bacterium]|nr:hypothetical protein LBMAG48_05300 [Phycisphaerae bacterium]